MQIRIAGIVPESFVDGAGIRYVVFMQGCLRRCAGCHNPHTHDLSGGYLVESQDLIAGMKKNSCLTGLTLTGGEPFLQVDASIELSKAAKHLGLSVWCYTGFKYEEIKESPLLAWVDVLVDGEFNLGLRDLNLKFRGSSNQRLINVAETRRRNEIVLIKEEQ